MKIEDIVLSIVHQNRGKDMQKTASGWGDLGSAITYLVLGSAAAAGAGIGLTLEKGFEPTDTDIGNAQRAYAIANLKANIDSQRRKLLNEQQRMQLDNQQKTLRLV